MLVSKTISQSILLRDRPRQAGSWTWPPTIPGYYQISFRLAASQYRHFGGTDPCKSTNGSNCSAHFGSTWARYEPETEFSSYWDVNSEHTGKQDLDVMVSLIVFLDGVHSTQTVGYVASKSSSLVHNTTLPFNLRACLTRTWSGKTAVQSFNTPSTLRYSSISLQYNRQPGAILCRLGPNGLHTSYWKVIAYNIDVIP